MEKKKLDIAYLKRLAGKGAKLVLNLMLLPLLPIALLAGLLGAVFKDTVKETATETANLADGLGQCLVPYFDDVFHPCWDDFYLS